VWGLFTRAEEVGFLGALEAVRLGTVPAGASVLSLECSKALPSAPQGDGVIVRVGDRMSIFDPDLTQSLRTAADALAGRDRSFRYQRKLMDGGACEATVFCASGFRASGLAVPLGNYHNASDDGIGIAPEHVVVDDWLAEVALLVELGCDPGLFDDETAEPPPWLQERAATARATLGAA
jgi:endoglucanase